MHTQRELFLEAIAKVERLFPAPRTLGRALVMLRDPDSDLGDIAALIGSDPALAAEVLRNANSAYYGSGVHLSAIDQAVQKIGSRETIRIVGRAIAQSMTRHDLGSYGIDAEDFWAESLFNGLFLERLARLVRVIDVDEAYLAGLLRYVGRLAINQALHDFGAGLFWDREQSIASWEQANVGVTQGEAGGILLRRWQLSESVALAVENQDSLQLVHSSDPLVQAMHFAARVLPPGLELDFFVGDSERPVAIPHEDPFVRVNGLSVDAIAVVLDEAREVFNAVREEHYH